MLILKCYLLGNGIFSVGTYNYFYHILNLTNIEVVSNTSNG
jgi:hypothetical protein